MIHFVGSQSLDMSVRLQGEVERDIRWMRTITEIFSDWSVVFSRSGVMAYGNAWWKLRVSNVLLMRERSGDSLVITLSRCE